MELGAFSVGLAVEDLAASMEFAPGPKGTRLRGGQETVTALLIFASIALGQEHLHRLAKHFVQAEVRHFSVHDRQAALAWLGESPVPPRH